MTYVDFVVAAAAIVVVDAAVASKPCFDILYCEFVNGILIRWDETFFQRKIKLQTKSPGMGLTKLLRQVCKFFCNFGPQNLEITL